MQQPHSTVLFTAICTYCILLSLLPGLQLRVWAHCRSTKEEVKKVADAGKKAAEGSKSPE